MQRISFFLLCCCCCCDDTFCTVQKDNLLPRPITCIYKVSYNWYAAFAFDAYANDVATSSIYFSTPSFVSFNPLSHVFMKAAPVFYTASILSPAICLAASAAFA